MDTTISTRVRSKHGVVQVDELQLDVVCSNFGDRIFLLVTNLSKVGTLLEVSRDSLLASSNHIYSVRTLLGKDNAEIHAFGRALASTLDPPTNLPILVGIGLKDHTPSLLVALLPQLQEFRTW